MFLGKLTQEVIKLPKPMSKTNLTSLTFFFTVNPLSPPPSSVTRKKSPNVHKSCPRMISLQKRKFLTPLQKLPKNVGDLGKFIIAKGFKKLPKVQNIAQSGHTAHVIPISLYESIKDD